MSTQDFEFKALTDPYMVQPGQTGSSRSRTPNKSSLRRARKQALKNRHLQDVEKAKALEKERGKALFAALFAEVERRKVPKEFEKRPEEVPNEFEKRPAGEPPHKSMPIVVENETKSSSTGDSGTTSATDWCTASATNWCKACNASCTASATDWCKEGGS